MDMKHPPRKYKRHGENCIINADSIEEAEKIAKACPIITSIRVYEAGAM
jgi:hypothetical protein